MIKKQCLICAVELGDREWDEGNNDKCYECRLWELHVRIRELEKIALRGMSREEAIEYSALIERNSPMPLRSWV